MKILYFYILYFKNLQDGQHPVQIHTSELCWHNGPGQKSSLETKEQFPYLQNTKTTNSWRDPLKLGNKKEEIKEVTNAFGWDFLF